MTNIANRGCKLLQSVSGIYTEPFLITFVSLLAIFEARSRQLEYELIST